MDLLTEAKLDRRFRSSTRDLQRLYCGYYFVELLRTMTDEADPHPELFDLAIEAIQEIDGEGNPAETVFRFEVGLLRSLGHTPMLTRCVVCGASKTRVDRVYFGLKDGGLLCNDCSRGKSAIRILGTEGLRFLMHQFDVKLETDSDSSEKDYGSSLFSDREGYRESRQNNEPIHESSRRSSDSEQKYLDHL